MADPQLQPGQLLMTPTVQAEVDPAEMLACIRRHLTGDYGDTDPADARLNRESVLAGEGRVMSEYLLADGSRLWVSTDGIGTSEHHTLVMRPEDY